MIMPVAILLYYNSSGRHCSLLLLLRLVVTAPDERTKQSFIYIINFFFESLLWRAHAV